MEDNYIEVQISNSESKEHLFLFGWILIFGILKTHKVSGFVVRSDCDDKIRIYHRRTSRLSKIEDSILECDYMFWEKDRIRLATLLAYNHLKMIRDI